VNSPRGATFSTPNKGSNLDDSFFVSAKQSSGVPVRFGELDPSYTATFQAFSPERLFTPRDSNVITIQFFVPGTKIPALVKGFGVVLTDVDVAASASITLYGLDGDVLGSTHGFQTAPGGLSFWGVVFPDEPIASVVLVLGNTPLASGAVDGTAGVDVVAMDDFIYGEPHAREAHTADFDGDSLADLSVFRPSSGQWFVLNSGSNTFGISTFGLPGAPAAKLASDDTSTRKHETSRGVFIGLGNAFRARSLACAWSTARPTWTAPTTNNDGSALTNLASYRIKYGRSSTSLDQIASVTNPSFSSGSGTRSRSTSASDRSGSGNCGP